jgi:predicted metal-dependent hydrolase
MYDDSRERQLTLDFSAPAAAAWPVRESARARRLSARVFRDGKVEIVVPTGTRPRTIQKFVAHSTTWINAAVARAVGRPPPLRLVSDEFPPRELALPAVGEVWGAAELRLAARSAATLQRRLRLQLRQRAAAAFAPQLHTLAATMGVEVSSVQVRLQHSRWGSCTRRGGISLNACLLFQRPEVVRYLLVHELAHRVHLNHGGAFWRLVERHEPHWRELDRELARGFQRVPRWIFGLATDQRR